MPEAHELPALICPRCHFPIAAVRPILKIPTTTRYEDCLRRCEICEIGASNAANPEAVTYICLDPLQNIPEESRDGALETLAQAFNVNSRASKLSRFGFDSSEDAVTWVIFTYLLRSGQLYSVLKNLNLTAADTPSIKPTLLLWGVPVTDGPGGKAIRKTLGDQCESLGENPKRFSEPDVIIDLGENGLILIEVKYWSGNDSQEASYSHWSRYGSAPGNLELMKASGCYELTRNWCLLNRLAGRRPATLVNLGFSKLFRGPEGERLDRFVAALRLDQRCQFRKITWSELLYNELFKMPKWLAEYCKVRRLNE